MSVLQYVPYLRDLPLQFLEFGDDRLYFGDACIYRRQQRACFR
jgi:hypothetical protein